MLFPYYTGTVEVCLWELWQLLNAGHCGIEEEKKHTAAAKRSFWNIIQNWSLKVLKYCDMAVLPSWFEGRDMCTCCVSGLLFAMCAVCSVPAAVRVSGQHAVLAQVSIMGTVSHIQLDQITLGVHIKLPLQGWKNYFIEKTTSCTSVNHCDAYKCCTKSQYCHISIIPFLRWVGWWHSQTVGGVWCLRQALPCWMVWIPWWQRCDSHSSSPYELHLHLFEGAGSKERRWINTQAHFSRLPCPLDLRNLLQI